MNAKTKPSERVQTWIKLQRAASTVQSNVEFLALSVALEQYIQNTEEVEDGLTKDQLELLKAARRLQERVDAVAAATADEALWRRLCEEYKVRTR